MKTVVVPALKGIKKGMALNIEDNQSPGISRGIDNSCCIAYDWAERFFNFAIFYIEVHGGNINLTGFEAHGLLDIIAVSFKLKLFRRDKYSFITIGVHADYLLAVDINKANLVEYRMMTGYCKKGRLNGLEGLQFVFLDT